MEICDDFSWQHPVVSYTVEVVVGTAYPGICKLPETSDRMTPAHPKKVHRRPSRDNLPRNHHRRRSGTRTPCCQRTPAILPVHYLTCARTGPVISISFKTITKRRKRRAARGACVLCRRAPREGSQPHNWMSRDYIELCRLQMVSDPCDSFCRHGGPRARPT